MSKIELFTVINPFPAVSNTVVRLQNLVFDLPTLQFLVFSFFFSSNSINGLGTCTFFKLFNSKPQCKVQISPVLLLSYRPKFSLSFSVLSTSSLILLESLCSLSLSLFRSLFFVDHNTKILWPK